MKKTQEEQPQKGKEHRLASLPDFFMRESGCLHGFSLRAFLCLFVAIFFLLQPAPLPAVSPLAMRVDVQPSAITPEGTMMTIEVQLAPQDRGRIGDQARMRIKLNQGSKALVHILQDVDFDNRGMTRMEYLWPPGSYELLLTIESLRGTATGLWVGPVVIPESLDQTPAAPPAEPKVEEPKTETKTPVQSSLADAASAAVAAAPVVASAPPSAKAPVAETKKTVATQTPRNSGPVYALVLDIDSSDLELADRAAELRASIDRRFEDATPIIIQGGDSNPTVAISRALKVLEFEPETKGIIVLTDARRKASHSQWKTIVASVQSSKIPIFVIGLWNDEFNPGTRKQFKRLATDSGGRSYVLQPAESPARALEMVESQ